MEKTTTTTPPEVRLGENHIFTAFEPKVISRFIVKITNENKEELIPPFVIFRSDRPSFRLSATGNTKVYDPFWISAYDPIVPSTAQAVELAYWNKSQWNIDLKILGPVGDTVEHWSIGDAKLLQVQYSSLDWTLHTEKDEIHSNAVKWYFKHGPAATVDLKFEIDMVKLNY